MPKYIDRESLFSKIYHNPVLLSNLSVYQLLRIIREEPVIEVEDETNKLRSEFNGNKNL